MMKTFRNLRIAALCVAVLGLALATTATAQIEYLYDAGPEFGGPADLDPVLQGWAPNEVDLTPGPLQNVFFLQPDFGTGFNALLIDDQHGSTNPSPNDNPRYDIFLQTSDYQGMWNHGWDFSFRFRPIQGGNFVQWAVGPDDAVNIFGLPGRRRVGFGVSIDDTDNSAVVNPVFGDAVNLGPDSANEYHLVEASAGPQTTLFDLSIDGTSLGMFDIADGGSNSSNDNLLGWQSGSSGGEGRSAGWNMVNLNFVPEPTSALLYVLGAAGLLLVRRRNS